MYQIIIIKGPHK